MSKMSRRKGAKGEVEVAHAITDWWRELEPEATFRRTGELGRLSRDARLFGDILPRKTTRWQFTVEVKRVEAVNYEWWINCKPSPVWKWWKQAVDDARDAGNRPMLWMRKNGEPWVVLLEASWFGATDLEHPTESLAAWGERFMGKLGLPATVAFQQWQFVSLNPKRFALTA